MQIREIQKKLNCSLVLNKLTLSLTKYTTIKHTSWISYDYVKICVTTHVRKAISLSHLSDNGRLLLYLKLQEDTCCRLYSL